MSYKKILFLVGFLAMAFFILNFSLPQAKAYTDYTAEELLHMIQEFQKQIAELRARLSELRPEPVWCHTFNVNLGVGNTQTEVRALQTALQKEGLYERDITGRFDEYTASAVVSFQEKYASDILNPLGLTHGTGYVGSSTRAKLNEIYGCPSEIVYLNLVSPRGGEVLELGKTHSITWRSAGLERIDISLCEGLATFPVVGNCSRVITRGVFAEPGEYVWIIRNIEPGDDYRIRLFDHENRIYAESRNFSVVKDVAEPSIKIISPREGQKITGGTTYTVRWESGGLTQEHQIFFHFPYIPSPFPEPIPIPEPVPLPEIFPEIEIEELSSELEVAFSAPLIPPVELPHDATSYNWRVPNVINPTRVSLLVTVHKDGQVPAFDRVRVEIIPKLTEEVTCSILQSSPSANYYFNLCRDRGYDKVCFNKYTSVYQGCSRSSYNDCTLHNVNAAQNIWCDVDSKVTCWEPTENFDSGCKLLLHYDEDNDGVISMSEFLAALNDHLKGKITDPERDFVRDSYMKRSINALCPNCWSLDRHNLTVRSRPVPGIRISSNTGHSGMTTYNIPDIRGGTRVSLTAPLMYGNYVFQGWDGCYTVLDEKEISVDDLITSLEEHQTVMSSIGDKEKVIDELKADLTTLIPITCNLVMNSNKSVTARYREFTIPPTLSVTSTPTTGARITSITGHSGTTNYMRFVSPGTRISLTAPSSYNNRVFSHWSGCVTSTSRSISLIMPSSNTACRANYESITPSITVISPNGGENWQMGKTYPITWRSEGIDRVIVSACRSEDDFSCVLIGPREGIDASLRRHNWTVQHLQGFVEPGSRLKIRIAEYGNPSLRDFSDGYFSIIKPSITVTSPREGAELIFGRPSRISWTEVGLLEDDSIDILLHAYDQNYRKLGDVYFIASSFFPPHSPYTWVPYIKDLDNAFGYAVPREYYRIEVRRVESPIYRADASGKSGYFRIINETKNGELCRKEVVEAQEYSRGMVCALIVAKLACPHDSDFTYLARDACEISFLEKRGWEKIIEAIETYGSELDILGGQLASIIETASGLLEQMRVLLEKR